MKTTTNTATTINFMYWLANYNSFTMQETFNEIYGKSLGSHLYNKWVNNCHDVGGTRGLIKLFYELDKGNQELLINYVTENYKS